MAAEQKTAMPCIVKEVIVERIVDRAELIMKEEELNKVSEDLASERIKSAQLTEEVSTLTKELAKYQNHFKLIKMPHSYRIQSTSTTPQSLNNSAYNQAASVIQRGMGKDELVKVDQ